MATEVRYYAKEIVAPVAEELAVVAQAVGVVERVEFLIELQTVKNNQKTIHAIYITLQHVYFCVSEHAHKN